MAFPLPSPSLDPIPCCECGTDLPVGVFQSAAGYYIGRWCPNCGPYERLSIGYWGSREEAALTLDAWNREG